MHWCLLHSLQIEALAYTTLSPYYCCSRAQLKRGRLQALSFVGLSQSSCCYYLYFSGGLFNSKPLFLPTIMLYFVKLSEWFITPKALKDFTMCSNITLSGAVVVEEIFEIAPLLHYASTHSLNTWTPPPPALTLSAMVPASASCGWRMAWVVTLPVVSRRSR